MAVARIYDNIQNYIYLYHTDTYIVLPTYPEQIQDGSTANYAQTPLLGRSAPTFSYSNSGPRTLDFTFPLHRDMMQQINGSNPNLPNTGEDYVDLLIKQIQAAAVPNYDASEKMVNPPMVAVRVGTDVYIKGVINSRVSVTYDLPIIRDENSPFGERYARVTVAFGVSEIDPYDAEVLAQIGSFRKSDLSMGDGILATLSYPVIKHQDATVALPTYTPTDINYSVGGTTVDDRGFSGKSGSFGDSGFTGKSGKIPATNYSSQMFTFASSHLVDILALGSGTIPSLKRHFELGSGGSGGHSF